MIDIMEFINENIIGVILFNVFFGIIGSVLGSLLYNTMTKKYKDGKFKKYLIKLGIFFRGEAAGLFMLYISLLFTKCYLGDYLIQIVLSLGKLIICGIVSVTLLIILRAYWFTSPIIVLIAGLFCGIEYRKLRDFLKLYREMFKYVYGEEYFKTEMDGIKQYWDKTTGNYASKEKMIVEKIKTACA